MKEFLAGMFLVVGFAAAIGFAGSRSGADIKSANRAELWNDLQGRDTGPVVRDSRFSRPRGAPVEVTSPVVAMTPAAEMAGALATFATDMGERIGPEAGLPYLMSGAARLIGGETPAKPRKPSPEVETASLMMMALRSNFPAEAAKDAPPRPAGPRVATSPQPMPRPQGGPEGGSAAAGAQSGVLSVALDMLAKAGLTAMARAEGAGSEGGMAGADGLGKFAADGPPDPVMLLARRYRDRAPGMSI